MKKKYQPVQCDFYDYFEIYALYGKKVSIEYQSFEGKKRKYTGVIKDLRTEHQEEFLILEDHAPIRADQVLKIGPFENPEPVDFSSHQPK